MKYSGTKYSGKWDLSTWCMIAMIAICTMLPCVFDDDGYMPALIGFVILIITIIILRSVYYRIDDNHLIVYQFFLPTAFPIDKISEIYPIKTYLSAPATSLTDRIAIKFTDRKILKSTMPLIISPANKSDFIARLIAINPDIKVSKSILPQ